MCRNRIPSAVSRGLVATLLLASALPALGQTFSYIGPNNGGWQVPIFWAPYNPLDPLPLQPPPTSGDVAIIANGAAVYLSDSVPASLAADGLAGLSIANHSEVHTNGQQIRVGNATGDAVTNITGTGPTGGNTRLVVDTSVGSGFGGDIVNLTQGGELRLEDADILIENHLSVDQASILTGGGTISLFLLGNAGSGQRMDLDGTIRPDAGQTISLVGPNGTINLDGDSGTGYLDLTQAGARLNVHMPLTDTFSGKIDMGAASRLDMSSAWDFSGGTGAPVLNVDAGYGDNAARISGGTVTIGASSGQWNINSGGLWVTADAVIRSHADLNVDDGATLDFDGEVEYAGAASITGEGRFDPGSFNRVTADVTIATGTVEFDNGDWDIRQSLTLETNALEASGGPVGSNTFNGVIDIHTSFVNLSGVLVPIHDGRLTVDLPATDEWYLASGAEINIFGADELYSTHLAGSNLNINGVVNIDGRSRFTAPIDLNATGEIHFADNASRLNLAADSRLRGGTIDGNGTLVSARANVRGYGTIDSDVAFSESAELWADDGTLWITGNLDDLGARFGTAGSDAVLIVQDTSWDAAMADEVRLNGGQLTDGSVNTFVANRGGQIRGHGLISFNSLNNHGVIAAEGGELEIDGRLDWDGSSGGANNEGDGRLLAVEGDMLLSHPMYQGPSFVGVIATGRGRTFTYETGSDQDEILFDDVSGDGDAVQSDVGRLSMSGGTLVADVVSHEGQFEIQSHRSTIVADRIRFDELGTTSIASELALNTKGGSYSVVEAGATVVGRGTLRNTKGSTLYILDGADLGVNLTNDGALELNAHPNLPSVASAAGVQVRSFTQGGSGTYSVEIFGPPLSEFDRLAVDGGAKLAGTLAMYLANAYDPSIGESMELVAAGNVQGTFDATTAGGTPGVSIGLVDGANASIAVYYADTPFLDFAENTVNARISLSGDADGNDMVDVADLGNLATAWQSSGTWFNGDFDGSGFIDVVDLGILATNMNQSFPSTMAISAVPEPTTALLLILGAAAFGATGRRSRR